MKIPRFGPGNAIELNFVGEQLLKLPPKRCARIYKGLRSPTNSDPFGEAAVELIRIIAEAPEEQLRKYVSNALGFRLDAYIFADPREKAHLFAAFFFNHLRREGKKFTVGRIDLKTLKVT